MTVHPIGNTSVVIMIEEEDMEASGITPGTVNTGKVLGLVRSELKKSGVPEHAEIDVVAYPGVRGVLLFANVKRLTPRFFAFSSIEDLIGLSKEVSQDIPSSLSHLNGLYILTIRVQSDEKIPGSFYEYGEKLDLPLEFELHVAEHGQQIIESFAISGLSRLFRH